jgi:hypothetical protein
MPTAVRIIQAFSQFAARCLLNANQRQGVIIDASTNQLDVQQEGYFFHAQDIIGVTRLLPNRLFLLQCLSLHSEADRF